MAQPKDPPISIRLPKALSADVEAWAADHGLPRNAAIKALIELGLSGAASAPTTAGEQATSPKLDLPVLGSFERKPMQKASKK